jgi:hypothetical protein
LNTVEDMSPTQSSRSNDDHSPTLQITVNNKVRLIIRRAYGFHTAENALALILLTCGPVTLTLPYHTGDHPHS